MTAKERARHELLARLEAALGPDEAATLMENLPPRPWSELTTKDDLLPLERDVAGLAAETRTAFVHLHEVLDLRFEAQAARLEAVVRERFDAQTKLLVFSIIGALLTTAGIALGASAG